MSLHVCIYNWGSVGGKKNDRLYLVFDGLMHKQIERNQTND